MSILSEIKTFHDLIDSEVFNLNEDMRDNVAEQDYKKIGLFPGAYKPPHRGHYHTANVSASKADSLYIIISNSPREDINGEVARDVWEVYRDYILRDNPGTDVQVKMLDYAASPVAITYQIANIINNRHYVPGDRESDKVPLPGIPEISEEILQKYTDSVILMPVAGKGDAGRYGGLHRSDKYSGENIKHIDILEVERLTSATDVRSAILAVAQGQGDVNTIRQNLPDVLTPEDEEKVLSILLSVK
jgi:hypothetical protein